MQPTLWKESVMSNIKVVQKRFEQSLEFTASNFGGYKTLLPRPQGMKQIFFSPSEPVRFKKEARNFTINLAFKKNNLFHHARDCIRKSQRQLALYLNKFYETEFAPEFTARKTASPILEPECDTDLDLIIILTTRPGNFKERTAIRYSWGRQDSKVNKHFVNSNGFKYKTLFTIGRDNNRIIEDVVSIENSHYKDILRLDYPDTYENLPKKTVLTLEWIADNCQTKFVLKTDDDCYVNAHNLSPWLQKLNPNVKYVGKKNDFMPVIRDPEHRNYVPYDLFNEEYYKPYCAGGGYVLRSDVLKNITIKSKTIREIINEDAYMGMLTNSLNIIPHDDERFLPFIFSERDVRKRHMCDWTNKFLMHGVSPRRQLIMHWQKIAMIDYDSLCE